MYSHKQTKCEHDIREKGPDTCPKGQTIFRSVVLIKQTLIRVQVFYNWSNILIISKSKMLLSTVMIYSS